MKKIFLFLMAISAIFSCSKDDDPVKPDVPVTPTKVTTDSLKLLGYGYEVGNKITNSESKGSITVRFNHPVSCNSVKTDAENASWTTTNGDSALVISSPIEFNSEYKIELNMTDKTTGKTWPFTLTAKTFNGRYKYEGIVQSVIYDYDRERIWMATRFPNRLYSISMADPTKEVHKDFELCPNVLALNPYNDKLYVGFNIHDYDEVKLYDRKVHVLDSQTLKEESAFVVSLDNTTEEGMSFLPDATPISMAFTEDGFGVIVRSYYGDSATDFCYVDSKNGNKVTYDHNWENSYAGVATNYDQKSLNIYVMDYTGSDFYTVSRNNPTPKFHEITAQGSSIDYRQFHRSKPMYLIQCLGEIYMVDYSTDKYSPILVDEHDDDDRGDFDYSRDNCIVKTGETDNGWTKVIEYIDASKAEIKYAGTIKPSGYSIQSIFMHPSRDLLVIFYENEDNDKTSTIITTIDMKTIRH